MASILQSSNAQRDVVNKLVDSVENLKISTLVNAAKITPLVQERTIGPNQSHEQPNQSSNDRNGVNLTSNKSNNNSGQHSIHNGTYIESKFRKDVWREVNIESEQDETPKNMLHINDCKAISFRLAANNAEKQRRAKITTDLQVKQNQWDTELQQRMQQIRIDSAEKQKQTQAKRLERERQTLQAIEKIEAEAKQDEMNSNLKKSEMIEHSRKLIEHANQLKRQDELRLLVENINASKLLFINLFELFAKTIIGNQTLLNQTGKLAEYTTKRDALLQRYEKIMNTVNSKAISIAETEQFEKLCSDIKQEQIDLNGHIQSSREAQSQNNANDTPQDGGALQVQKSEPSIVAASEALKTNNANEISVTDGNAGVQVAPPNFQATNNIGNEDRISQYYELMNFYNEYKAQIEPLMIDANWKKFRFNCQKGVNTPVNSIAAVNMQHLQDKFEKISDLLSGNQIRVGEIPFTASEHPLGIKYCTLLLAKKFITQGTTVTSSHNQAAFPIAAVIIAIWQLFPDVGKLFLALLYVECPFFVPYFVPQKQGQSDNEYFSLLGYKFNDDKMEDQEQYLKRISGLQRLYSAVLITKLRRSQHHLMHPHGIENGWIWLTNFIMLDPLPGIGPTLLLEFIQICGAEMLQLYKKQFMKLMIIIHNQYVPKLDRVDAGGPYSRLKILITNIVKDNRVTPPSGTLQPNFW